MKSPASPPFDPLEYEHAAADPARWVEAVSPVLASGLHWLYDLGQPEGSVLQHHGWTLRVPPINRSLQFAPVAAMGRAVVALSVLNKRWTGGFDNRLLNGLGGDELDRLIALLAALGHGVVARWNGDQGLSSGSVALDQPAHDRLVAAVTRYATGCPIHHSVFCGRDEQCRWYADGFAKVCPPGAMAA